MWRLLALALWLCVSGATAQTCRQALAIGIDVSGSVDSREYRLQLDGLAGALLSPEVRRAILQAPDMPIRLAVFEWSGQGHQRLLVGWTALRGEEDLARVTSRLRAVRRVTEAPLGTSVGTAMLFGADLLSGQQECWRRTLDLSGDGMHNEGPNPRDVKSTLSGTTLTINALAVGADSPAAGDRRHVEIAELSSYFRALVIHGPDGFVETALGFEDFEAAMTRKLLRELQGIILSHRKQDIHP